ncbi:acetate--CoA ligase family protein [Niveispirillum sp. KHB5.9]|uniref:acetate--CoA ligase family protein n=1 Tax=Niveispirillum sp. KHB5.9 TaxID=3400269 RepID=UPI003A8BF8EF
MTSLSHPLARLFAPRSVALVGATEKSVWTTLIVRNFRDFAYDGALYAVNRNGVDTFGIKGFRSCRDIPEPVDVAFIFVPVDAVPDALADAASAGIRNVTILTSGYAEIGEEGCQRQDALVAQAKDLGVTLWGPNSLGYNNAEAGIPVSVIPAVKPFLPPAIAILSQSGATAAELAEYAQGQNIGTSFVAATGNEAQISLADIIDYLVDHDATKAIAVFAESIRNPAAFVRAAERARDKAKPIVILKIGRSDLATQVAQAHTGSLVGDDAVFDAICRRLGVIRVTATEDLVNTAGLLAATGPLPAGGMSFLSISGGACTLVADAAEGFGVKLPANDPATVAALRSVLSELGSTLNPLDITGAAMRDPDLFARVIPLLAANEKVGLLGIGIAVPTMPGQSLPPALTAIGRATAGIKTPSVLVSTCGKSLNDYAREAIAEHGLPHVMTGIDAMLRAAGNALWWSGQLKLASPPPALEQPMRTDAPILSTEREVLDFLAAKGVPVVPQHLVRNAEEAAKVAASFTGPLALKILSPDIAHKTEVGGVRLNVPPAEAASVFASVMADIAKARPNARLDGVIIAPMRSGGLEMLVGVRRDPTWGPVIAVGFGGVLVEMLADVAITPLPVNPTQAKALLTSLRGAKLLDGFRGGPPADIDQLAQVIVAIGDAALSLGGSLTELEVNPLRVAGTEIEALDGLVVWQEEA